MADVVRPSAVAIAASDSPAALSSSNSLSSSGDHFLLRLLTSPHGFFEHGWRNLPFNLVFMEDASGNRRPHKAKSIDRIDPAVAAILSIGRANASASTSYVNAKWADGLMFA
jgi:hypothetical protein